MRADQSKRPGASPDKGSGFSYSVEAQGQALLVTISGELDFPGMSAVHEAILADAAGCDAQEIVFDCAELTYAGARFLNMLDALRRRSGFKVSVRCASENIEKVLTIGGLAHLMSDVHLRSRKESA